MARWARVLAKIKRHTRTVGNEGEIKWTKSMSLNDFIVNANNWWITYHLPQLLIWLRSIASRCICVGRLFRIQWCRCHQRKPFLIIIIVIIFLLSSSYLIRHSFHKNLNLFRFCSFYSERCEHQWHQTQPKISSHWIIFRILTLRESTNRQFCFSYIKRSKRMKSWRRKEQRKNCKNSNNNNNNRNNRNSNKIKYHDITFTLTNNNGSTTVNFLFRSSLFLLSFVFRYSPIRFIALPIWGFSSNENWMVFVLLLVVCLALVCAYRNPIDPNALHIKLHFDAQKIIRFPIDTSFFFVIIFCTSHTLAQTSTY